MLGDQSKGNFSRGGPKFRHLRFVKAGGGDHQRNLLLPAGLDERGGSRWHGKIDGRVDGHVNAGRDRHALRGDAGHEPRVFAQAWMLGCVDGRGQGKLGVGNHQRDEPLSHASGGPVDSDAKWHNEQPMIRN